jgi:hypothetical protein
MSLFGRLRAAHDRDHAVLYGDVQGSRLGRLLAGQDAVPDLLGDLGVGAAVHDEHVGPADDPGQAAALDDDRQALDVAGVHEPGSLLDAVVRGRGNRRGGHEIGGRDRAGLLQLPVMQDPGDHARSLVVVDAEGQLRQQVRLGDHSDHAGQIVDHGDRADPALPQGGGYRLERRVLPDRDHVGGHHVLDDRVHQPSPPSPGVSTTLSAPLSALPKIS